MVGITSYGAYIPLYRLSRDEISRAWSRPNAGGEKAVANVDEDSITMAVEAVIDCLTGMDRELIDGLYLATTTAPYKEKLCASIVAVAADLRKEQFFAADFTSSVRAGTMAMKASIDAIKGGSAKKVIVAASDRRVPAPNSEFEPLFGDSAAAFVFGDSDVAVNIEGNYSISSEFMDIWRRDGDKFPRTWEDRFVLEEGYQKLLQQAVSGLMNKYSLTPKDFTKAIFYAPTARSHAAMARSLGFDAKTQVQDPMFATVGNTGTAFVPMMLVAALEEAKPGDKLLLANYGDGADCYILVVTEQIENIRDRRGIKRHLASKSILPNYEKYILFRDLMEWEFERRPPAASSLSWIWRDRAQVYRLHGQKCRRCGWVQFPRQRVCINCQAKDDFEDVSIADKKGNLFTFTHDERAMVPILPEIMCEIDFGDGLRLYCPMTDRDPEKVEIGMSVEMTFRNIHEGADAHNYFWVCRPIRC
ncbi:MAG: hydroxymethylglutaryl-CoA synthase [Chloroflexota bacterium]|nr:hydroxymethylglutaryl-CoA synthase [Chloroflexota bacterium]